MAKKIRPALLMDGDVPVSSISELREHFSVLKMLEYVSEEREKLLTWLRDRWEVEIAEKVEALDVNDGELASKICEIFGVEFSGQNAISLDDVKEAKEKREKLLQFTNDEGLLSHAADCAFEQDDIYDLLDAGKNTIYLCGERFNIPVSKQGVSYIGIKVNEKEPIALIDSKEKIDFSERNISFENVAFDEKYLEVCGAGETPKQEPFEDLGEFTSEAFEKICEEQGIKPDEITEFSIPRGYTSIGESAFSNGSALESVEIPSGVKSIGTSAFSACKALKRVVIPDSVKSIGEYAFAFCSSLTNVTIPNSIKSIEKSTFFECTALKSIEIPDGVVSICDWAFKWCTALKSVRIPDNVTSIGKQAFSGCSELESVIIPASVKLIDEEAFAACPALASVTMKSKYPPTFYGYLKFGNTAENTVFYVPADSVDSYKRALGSNYGHWSFEPISNTPAHKDLGIFWHDTLEKICEKEGKRVYEITEFTIPYGYTSIGSEAFGKLCSECESLRHIVIPDTVTSIGNKAFQSCSALENVTIPDSVTKIGDKAFEFCKALKTVVIPGSVTSIGSGAFWECEALESIVIPSGVTYIAECTFHSCHALKSVEIPNGVEWISEYAFAGCSSLTNITIPNSIKWIGKNAFWNCSALESIEIPDGVVSIGEEAFRGCSVLKRVRIPKSVESIDKRAFSACYAIESVTIEAVNPPKLGDYEIYNAGNRKLYVPSGSVDTYKKAKGWSKYSNCIEAISETSALDDLWEFTSETFEKICEEQGIKPDEITEFSIPHGYTSIGKNAFVGCSSLESVVIPNSVKKIGKGAFKKCTSLENVVIPDGVKLIDDELFDDCDSLESVVIPESVKSIGEKAFWGCSVLKSVTLPSKVKTICSEVFKYCSMLSNVTIKAKNPPDLVGIKENYFHDTADDLKIYVPAGSVNAYKNDGIWSEYSDFIEPIKD